MSEWDLNWHFSMVWYSKLSSRLKGKLWFLSPRISQKSGSLTWKFETVGSIDLIIRVNLETIARLTRVSQYVPLISLSAVQGSNRSVIYLPSIPQSDGVPQSVPFAFRSLGVKQLLLYLDSPMVTLTWTPILSKVFEHFLSVRVGRFMEWRGVLSPTQFTCRKGIRTCDALLCVAHTLQSALELRQVAK